MMTKENSSSEYEALHDWQKVVVNMIETHDELVGSEEFQSLSDYDINRLSAISMSLPKGLGHTTLASFIASKYPSAVIYTDMDHWYEISKIYPPRSDSEPISMYELHYALVAVNDPKVPGDIEKMKKKVSDKKVVIVDQASIMPVGIKDFLLTTARGKVIFLD